MFLVLDTETTGLPKNWSAPLSDLDNWPRMVQLAYLIYDGEGNQIGYCNRIVQPEGYIIPESASALHGITTERAVAEGMLLHDVLEDFDYVLQHYRPLLVAHNIGFDDKIVGAELLRKGFHQTPFQELPRFCTMMSTVDLCGLPRRKWPRLEQLHQTLFGEGFAGAYTANADAEVCAKCFFELRRRGLVGKEIGA